MWLKFIKFNYLLPKCALLSVWEILGFARFLVGFCHLALLCRSCKCYEKFLISEISATKLLITKLPRIDSITLCNQAKYPQDAPQQKLSILLLKPRHFTICRHIGSFDKISIKSSKDSDLLATLVKFNQASNLYLPHQQNFVENERSICAT